MFLKNIDIYHISPCWADAAKIRVKAKLSDDITEIMPYLNAELNSAIYNHHGPNLTLYNEFRLITLYPKEMTMIKALNPTDAHQVSDWLKNLINDIYERREQIEPVYERKRRPHPLQLYVWLPRTNCRLCGEYTCLAFATLVFSGQQKLKNCVPLFDKEKNDYREQREVLMELTAALGYEIA